MIYYKRGINLNFKDLNIQSHSAKSQKLLTYRYFPNLSLFKEKALGLGFEPRHPKETGLHDSSFETGAIPDYTIRATVEKLFGQQFLQLTALKHLRANIRATNKFSINIKLRYSWPITELFNSFSNRVI